MTIAGHIFNGPGDSCTCGKRLSDLSWVYSAQEADVVGKNSIAHTGTCTSMERDQILAAFDRIAVSYGGKP